MVASRATRADDAEQAAAARRRGRCSSRDAAAVGPLSDRAGPEAERGQRDEERLRRHEHEQETGRAGGAEEGQVAGRARSDATGEQAQQAGQEGEGRQAARPIGSRPSRRATAGSSAPTTAMLLPMPTAATRSSRTLRCRIVGRGSRAWDGVARPSRSVAWDAKSTHTSSRSRLGLRGELTGSATCVACADGPRFAPGGIGSPVPR